MRQVLHCRFQILKILVTAWQSCLQPNQNSIQLKVDWPILRGCHFICSSTRGFGTWVNRHGGQCSAYFFCFSFYRPIGSQPSPTSNSIFGIKLSTLMSLGGAKILAIVGAVPCSSFSRAYFTCAFCDQ